MLGVISIALGLREFNVVLKRNSAADFFSEEYLIEGHNFCASLAKPERFPNLQRVSIFLDRNICNPSINNDNVQSVVMDWLNLGLDTSIFRVTLCEDFKLNDLLEYVGFVFSCFLRLTRNFAGFNSPSFTLLCENFHLRHLLLYVRFVFSSCIFSVYV